jgi:UDPglucose--hexose-1-phosphate uridylyltransferase
MSVGTQRLISQTLHELHPFVRKGTYPESTVSQLRLNLLTGRWVTVVPDRANRSTDFAPRAPQVESGPEHECPFCPEYSDPDPALIENSDASGTWQSRVVANRFPAFVGDESLAVRNLGPVHVMAQASGTHEVFVFSPDHTNRLDMFSDEKIRELMLTLRSRFIAHKNTPNIRYTQAIVNHGREAGASLSHPHGQLLGLPFVPGEILEEERAFERFKGGCIVCTTAEAESHSERFVLDNEHAVVVCPFWSSSPYELLIMPKDHHRHLPDSTEDELTSVGIAIRDALAHLVARLGDIAFNLVFHTAPSHHEGMYHWHVHLWPKLTTAAGFERGTGVMINIMPPETAAAELRNVAVQA